MFRYFLGHRIVAGIHSLSTVAAMVFAGQTYLFCAPTLFRITGRILYHAQPFGKKGVFACDCLILTYR